MLRKSIVFMAFCIVMLGIMTISAYAAENGATKIACTQTKVGSEAIPATIELINVSGLGGDIGNIRVISSVNGFEDITVHPNQSLSPAEALRKADAKAYTFSGESNDVLIVSNTIISGETLAVDLANTSIVFDGWGEGMAATVAEKGAWTIEVSSALSQGDTVIIEGSEYEFNTTPGFTGNGVNEQAASLAKLLINDLTDFDITVNGNVITCTQKIAGIGSVEALEEAGVELEPQQPIVANDPILNTEADSIELKINSEVVNVDGVAQSYPDDYGMPFVDKATGKTYVPVRMFCEALDFTVDWDADNSEVIIGDHEGNIIVLKIGESGIYDQFGNIQAVVADENGNISSPHIIEGRTYIQLTAFAYSALGVSASDISYISGNLVVNL